MIIERVEAMNFRSLQDVELKCDLVTTIVGRNGSGKSSLLKAVEVFYNLSYQANDYDYFAKDPSREIRIRVTYSELRADELEEFTSYLSDDKKLVVTKIITKGGVRYVGVSKGIPLFEEIRQLTKATDKRDRFNELVEKGEFAGLGTKAKSAADVEKRMGEYEAAHPGDMVAIEKGEQFFGATNIGAGKLDNYTRFVLVPAVRDAVSEAEKRGTIHQLIEVLVSRSIAARADVQEFNAEFEAKAKAVYSKENLGELAELASDITGLLSLYAPGAALDLEFEDVTLPKIALPNTAASVIEDEFKCPISYCGHGVQRALVLALLQRLSFIDRFAAKEGTVEGVQPKVKRPPDLILAIEEPELYLHPSRSRYLAGLLSDLCRKPADPDGPRTQVMYATHSPYFIDLNAFDRIRVARKIPSVDARALQCTITSFSRSEAAAQLSKVHEKDPAKFTPDSFVARATPVMTSLVNEGFFADVVVVVEGATELGVFSSLQQILKKDWEAKGIVVVSAEGKNNIDRPVTIFRGLKIRTYCIFDGDEHQKEEAKRKAAAETNRAYLRMNASAEIVDFPKTSVNETWAVFERNIEAELESALGTEVFVKIRGEVAQELAFDDTTRLLKSVSGAAALIRRIYLGGKRVQVLENIVDQITDLALKDGKQGGEGNQLQGASLANVRS